MNMNTDRMLFTFCISLFNLLFFGWFFWKKYQLYRDPVILIVDSQTKTVELKGKKSGNKDMSYKDVLRIEISPGKSGSYVYDYLKIILNTESLRVIRAESTVFSSKKSMTDMLAEEIATWTGKELERK